MNKEKEEQEKEQNERNPIASHNIITMQSKEEIAKSDKIYKQKISKLFG